jgi:hypothetical protein
MRKVLIIACLASAGCARGGASADSTAAATPDSAPPRDSTIVAGPPAAPVTKASSTPTSSTPRPTSQTPVSPSGSTRLDSVRGIVSVVGTSFEKRVMVAEQGTQRRIEVVGPQASVIGHVAGAELSVAGLVTGTRIDATRFVVRSVDGQPAIDGTLRTEGGILYIVSHAGTRTRIVTPPPPLVGRDGARVWITGDPAKGVSSFGFIDPPR